MLRKIIYQIPKHILLAAIAVYRLLVSPLLGDCCRFYPSCSLYGRTAIRRHGFIKGLYFTLRRLLRCHPLHTGGYDPVPQKKKGFNDEWI
jgi:uncharacterized protein